MALAMKRRRKTVKRRNPVAKTLAQRRYRERVGPDKKAYTRKGKRAAEAEEQNSS
jgi:hypothetical protein